MFAVCGSTLLELLLLHLQHLLLPLLFCPLLLLQLLVPLPPLVLLLRLRAAAIAAVRRAASSASPFPAVGEFFLAARRPTPALRTRLVAVHPAMATTSRLMPLRSWASAAVAGAPSGFAALISRRATASAASCAPRRAAAPSLLTAVLSPPQLRRQRQPWTSQRQQQWHEAVARRCSSSASAASAAAASCAAAAGTVAAHSPRSSSARVAVGAAAPAATCASLLQQLGGGASQLYSEVMRSAVQQYRQQQATADALLLPLLQQNDLVLFMEGTVDNPGSLASLNVVRMLQQLQAVPLLTVDVLAHPVILGFAAARFCSSANRRPPLLLVRGECLGSHDALLHAYSTGSLQQYLSKTVGYVPRDPQQPLPIALY